MTQQNIIIGAKDAKAGDTYFDAFTKTEANFTELFANLSSQANNVVVVNQESDFPTQDASTITLEANKSYFIGAVITTSKRFIVEEGASIRSINRFSIVLIYTGTGIMFTSVNVNWSISNIAFSCSSGTIFAVSGSGNAFAMTDAVCFGADNIGSFTDITAAFSVSAIVSISGQGFSLAGTISNFTITNFVQIASSATHIGVNFGTAVITNIDISGYEASGPLGSTAISGAASSANVASSRIATVSNSTLDGSAMVPLSVISRKDIRWRFEGNSGVPDTKEAALINFKANATATVISSTSTDGSNAVLVAGAWIEQDVSHFTSTAAGRMTYIGEKNIEIPIDVLATANPATNSDLALYIALNGAPIAATGLVQLVKSADTQTQSTMWQLTLSQNDFIEVFIENQTSTSNITVIDIIARLN